MKKLMLSLSFLATLILLTACPSGGTQPKPASLSISPTSATVTVGDSATKTFTATLENSSETVTWKLTGAGTLSTTSGKSTVYTPPTTGTAGTATLKATAGTLSKTATITIKAATPAPSLSISPTSATVTVGDSATKTFTATLENSSETVTWELTGAGTLSTTSGNRTVYTPPATGTAGTATLRATAGTLSKTATITIKAATPAPSLSISPSTLPDVQAGSGTIVQLRATLANSSDPITWSLKAGSIGTLNGTTGTNTNYNVPNTLPAGETSHTDTIIAKAGAITAEVSINITAPAPTATQRIVAYAWANDATAASYTPAATYSYNAAGGAITAKRSSKGNYDMTFADLSLAKGNVQVSAYNSKAYCNVDSWGGSTAFIACYDAAGNPIDSKYVVTITTESATSTAKPIAYAWANDATTASYTPNSTYSYNAAGGAITAKRSSKGNYNMTFANLNFAGGNVQVSAYQSKAYCNVDHWSGSTAFIICYDAAGNPTDSNYVVTITTKNATNSAKPIAYAWANDVTTASYTPDATYSYNAAGGAITAKRSAKGEYNMTFANLNLNEGNVQVSAYQSKAYCNVDHWSGSTAFINCYDAAGNPADSSYVVTIIK